VAEEIALLRSAARLEEDHEPARAERKSAVKTIAKFQGRRIDEPPHIWEGGQCPYQPGDYWKSEEDWKSMGGSWYGVTPNGLLGWFKNHHVEEHEDGTISIVQGSWGSNSILVNGDRPNAWHGCIDRGVWIEF